MLFFYKISKRFADLVCTPRKILRSRCSLEDDARVNNQHKASANTVFYQIYLPAASSQMRMQSGWL